MPIMKIAGITGSLHPKKLIFDRLHYRTVRLTEAVGLTYGISNGFSGSKNGKTEAIFNLSNAMIRTVRFPNYFIPDLTRLASLLSA